MYTPGPQTQQPPQMGVEPLNSGVTPEPQAKPKTPNKSKGNTDVGAFIQQLISLMAYVHQLQVQSHLIHFNYEGSNFLGVHKFLGKQYEAHIEQFDKLGEFRMKFLQLVPDGRPAERRLVQTSLEAVGIVLF